MSALKLALLALSMTAACEGPTLFVGDLQALDAGGPEDAAAPRVDATFDATLPDARVVVRDAGPDGRVDVIIIQRCYEASDCRDPRYPRCNTTLQGLFICTGCQFDRDCKQNEYCDEQGYWQCRERKDDSSPMMGGSGGP